MPFDDEPPFPDHDTGNVRALRENPAREAEQALLAAMIRRPEAVASVLDLVDDDDFDEPNHRAVFTAAASVLQHQGVAPDHILLRDELLKSKNQAALRLLVQLECPNPDAIHQYAEIVHTEANRRRAAAQIRQALHQVETATPDSWYHRVGDAMDSLDHAIETIGGPVGPTRSIGYVGFEGLFSRPRTPTPWVCAPILAKGRITLMYSPGKTGKSLIAMEAAAAIATGRPALASDASAPEHVLYVDQEMTEEDWLDRLINMGYGPDDEKLLAEHLHIAQLQAWPPMDTAAGGQALEAEARRVGATTVIIDTVSKVIAGEENANDTQQAFYRHTLIPLKRSGAAVLVLDHTGKDIERGARGASAKTDNIDIAFELLKRGTDLFAMRCTHTRIRDDLLEHPTFLRRTDNPTQHIIEAHLEPTDSLRPTHLMERVSRYVEANPGATKNAIETAVKGKREYVRLALELLVTEQYVEAEIGPNRAVTHRHVKRFGEDLPDDHY